jgi:phosphatidylinositol phospholipase C delta
LDLDTDLNTPTTTGSPPSPNDDSTPTSITKAQWEEYLLSKFNAAYDPDLLQAPSQDDDYWNHPISYYWINTSHNTYLLGDQLQSKSSVEADLMSLERGCKCLELDCWDGGSGNQAVVFHGHTLTSKILFVDILKVVRAYLKANPTTLPIILSLENHCLTKRILTIRRRRRKRARLFPNWPP